jgi:hypothetical protein
MIHIRIVPRHEAAPSFNVCRAANSEADISTRAASGTGPTALRAWGVCPTCIERFYFFRLRRPEWMQLNRKFDDLNLSSRTFSR